MARNKPAKGKARSSIATETGKGKAAAKGKRPECTSKPKR